MENRQCETFLNPNEIDKLVLKIKKQFDERDFNKILSSTKKIYFNRIESYFSRKRFLSLSEKRNLKRDYKLFIYNAIINYKPERKSRFTTYLYNATNYMLYTMGTKEYLEEKKKKLPYSALYATKSEQDSFFEIIYANEKNEDYDILKDIVNKCLDKFPDKRIKKILDIRFNKYKNKNALWKEVSKEVGCTHQYCHFLLSKFFKLLKKELDKNNYVRTK